VMRMWGNYGQRARHALQSNSASNDRGNYRERHYTQMCCVFMCVRALPHNWSGDYRLLIWEAFYLLM
jgi:hypothetical protein